MRPSDYDAPKEPPGAPEYGPEPDEDEDDDTEPVVGSCRNCGSYLYASVDPVEDGLCDQCSWCFYQGREE